MSAWQPGRWSPSVWVGAIMVAVFVLLGVFGPLLAPYPVGTRAMDLDHMYAPMSWSHWLGTDKSGVDTLSQLLHGAREALILSTLVVAISATIGVTIGMIAGYARGIVDETIMRIVDIFLAFPGLLLNIAIVAVVAKPGLPLFIAALCANGWVGYARVARGQVLSLRERDYVMAARALGASTPRILYRHIAPNLIAPILVQVSLSFGNVIAAEASLSFLGLGVPPPLPSWGLMIAEAKDYMFFSPWIIMVPGISLFILVLGINFMGASSDELVFTPLIEDAFVLACRRDNPLAAHDRLTWRDLEGQPLIGVSRTSGNRLLLDRGSEAGIRRGDGLLDASPRGGPPGFTLKDFSTSVLPSRGSHELTMMS